MAALEKIGMEAILKDDDFQKGLAAYIRGVEKAVAKTDQAGQQMTKSTEAIGKSWQSGAKKAGVAMGAMGAAGVALLTKVTMTAARTEELGIVLNTVGRNIGKTADQMKEYESGVKSMGITTQASRQAIIQMVQANLDLSKSTELARLAQDAAVIAQLDSSEAFQTLITVIQRGSLVMARTLGLTVDFQGAYKRLADELGITTTALTQQQKIQARTNEVLAQSVNIAGTYEAAMGSAGKQLRSMSRHVEELQNELGSNLLPVMGEIVGTMTDLLKMLREMDPVLKTTVVEFGAVASAVLLVGGALTAMAPGIVAVIGALGGPVTVALVAVTALVAGIAALVIHMDNVEKASEEAAAGVLKDADSFEEYEQGMRNAGEEARTLTEEIYNLAKATRDLGDFIAFQRAAEDLEEQIRKEGDAIQHFESGLASHFGVLGGGVDDYDKASAGLKEYVRGLDEAGLRIAVSTDAIYEWLRAEDVSAETARSLADELQKLAAIQQFYNLLTVEGVNSLGGWAGSAVEAADAGASLNEVQEDMEARIAALKKEIAALAEETGLTEKQVEKFKIELGYTDDEIKKMGEDFHLTGKELDDLAKKTGLSKDRIKELNQTMGQKDIEDYAKALKDAAKATGLTADQIDNLAQSANWGADDIKAFTDRIEDLEDALGDAKEELRGFFSALTGAMGDVRDANKDLADSTKNFEQNVSDIRRNVGDDIDAIKEKYDNMLPDKTTAEQRMRDQGNAWDEWAHRALATLDDVVSGDEDAWEARIRAEAVAVGIIQQENETTYDYMHRIVKNFYENKIPGLIQTESGQYQALTAEKAILRDQDIADAEAAADALLAIAQQQYNEEQKILRQARNERALLGALQVAEATGELGEFTQQMWPGAIGDMRADAQTFFDDWKAGLIDLSDPEIAAKVAEWGTELLSALGATKTEFQDNTKETRIFFQASSEGAKAAAAEIQAAKDQLVDLKTEQAALEAERGRLAMFGEVDPELEQDLQNVNDQIDDLEGKVGADGPFGTMTKGVEDQVSEVEELQAELDTWIDKVTTLGVDGVEAIDGITASTILAKDQAVIYHGVFNTFTGDAIQGLQDVMAEIEDLDGEKINITVVITTTYNPTVSTHAAIEAIHAALDDLPNQVSIDIQLAGTALAALAAADVGGEVGEALVNAIMVDLRHRRKIWEAPFELTKHARTFTGIGRFFAGLYDEEVLQPLLDDLDQLNRDLADTERLLEDQAFTRRLSTEQFLELQRNYNRMLRERNQLEEEYAVARAATERFERAKANLDILTQQLNLVRLLYMMDIDARGILSEIGTGIDAASEDWVDAMAAAMERLAAAAENKLKEFLGIASPSQKMIDIGLQMREGLIEGFSTPRLMAPAAGTTMQTTVNQTNDFSGMVISNGMDQAMAQAWIVQTVRKGMRGY